MRTALYILLTLCILSTGAAVYLYAQLSATRREVASAAAEPVDGVALAAARAAEKAATRRAEDLAQSVRYLEAELLAEQGRRRDVDEFLRKTEAALRAERERHNKEIWSAKQFMPEGVRQALLSLNGCLRRDGHDGLRFLKARALEDYTLQDVQLLDHDPGSLRSTLYIIGALTLKLDRETGKIALHLEDGFQRSPDGRRPFPEGGESLVLADIDGPEWEKRLPYLVQAEGEYPRPADEVKKPFMEPSARDGWQRRVNQLLDLAKTETRYRLDRFRNLQSARFEEALLLGLQRRMVITMSVEANAMSIVVDDRAKTVELVVYGGILRKKGGESEIPESGYRIQLPGVTAAQAIDVMQGMVVRR